MEVKSESDDVTECSHDDQPANGVYGLYHGLCDALVFMNTLIHLKWMVCCFIESSSIDLLCSYIVLLGHVVSIT